MDLLQSLAVAPLGHFNKALKHLVTTVFNEVDQAPVNSFVLFTFEVLVFKNFMKGLAKHVGVYSKRYPVRIPPLF